MQRKTGTIGPQVNRRAFAVQLALAAGVLASGSAPLARAAVSWNQLPVSPLVHADRRVTFLFQDAHAKSVVLALAGIPPAPLKKKAHGMWAVTVGPLAPEIYTYAFTVDGARVLDPLNPWVKPNLFYSASMVLVPGNPPSL